MGKSTTVKWTPAMLGRLEKLYAAGKSYTELAREFACDNHHVHYQVQKRGWPEKYRRSVQYRRKKPVRPKAAPSARYNPNPVTDTTRLLVCTSHYEGEDMRIIADILNRPPEQIEQILSECRKTGYYDLINAKEG